MHGTDGTLFVPDPNSFGGDVVRHAPGVESEVLEPSAGFVDSSRGVGLLDMIAAIGAAGAADGAGSPAAVEARANGGFALHVLDIMTGVLRAAETSERVVLTTTVERPAPVPLTAAEDWRR